MQVDETKTAKRDAALQHWLTGRLEEWQRLAELVKSSRDKRAGSARAPLELAERFRTLSRDRAMAHSLMPGSRLAKDLDRLFLAAHELVHRPPRRMWGGVVEVMRDEIPVIVHDMRGSIAVVVSLFILSGIAGWILVSANPELATLFASEGMIETVQSGELWTDGLLNIMPSSLLAASITANNIAVSITAFALGALFGLGTLYIIGLNGLMLGGIFAFTHQYGMADELFKFVVAHGVVELSVICLAGAAGLELGRALVEPGERTRREAFQDQAVRAGKLILAVAIFLVGAGLIEGYVSPDPAFGMGARVAIGLSYGVLMLWVLMGTRRYSRRSNPVPAPQQGVGVSNATV